MGWMLSIALGVPQHLPPPGTLPGHPGDPTRAFFPHFLRGVGWHWKVLQQLGILLILPEKAIMGEMVFGLAVVWVHSYQACISTMDEAVKKLELLTTSGENWAYTLVQFNEYTQHVLLPKESHLSTMIKGVPSKIVCRHLCQLEVHLLLQSECQVVYLEGLNGGLELVTMSLPESLTHGVHMLNDLTFLQVDLSRFTASDCAP